MGFLTNLLRRVRGGRPKVRSFAAADVNRLLSDWRGGTISANLELQGDLRALRDRARQLCQDNPHAAGYLRAMQDNVAGPDGLTLYPQVRRTDDSLDTAANREIKSAFARWGRRGTCTTDGQLSWVDVQRLMVACICRDGEFLALLRDDATNEFGFALQVLDPDLLDDTYNERLRVDGTQIVMGVELDRDGRPTHYHLLDRHPSEGRGVRVRTPADRVLHLFRVRRPMQSRGVPELTPAMVRLKMLDGWEEAHLVAARAGAARPLYFEEIEPDIDAGQDPNAASREERLRLDIEPGMASIVPFGYKAVIGDSKFPAIGYAEYQKAMLREIASGLGVAYNTFANDLENVNYSSIRGGLLAERDTFRAWHRWLAESACRPVYAAWLRAAIANRAVRVPLRDVGRLTEAEFQGRGWDWVDPRNDIEAFKTERLLGLNSLQRAARARGRDLEDVFREINEENELATEWGVTIGGPELVGEQVFTESLNQTGAGDGQGTDTTAQNAGRGHVASAPSHDDADRAGAGGGRRLRAVRSADSGGDQLRSAV